MNLHFGNIKLIILFSFLFTSLNTVAQKYLVFENDYYKYELESCGSSCNNGYFTNKKNNFVLKIFQVLCVDTNNYLIASIADNSKGFVIHNFDGILIKKIFVNTEYSFFDYYFFDEIYFENKHLVVKWNDLIDDPNFKKNSVIFFNLY